MKDFKLCLILFVAVIILLSTVVTACSKKPDVDNPKTPTTITTTPQTEDGLAVGNKAPDFTLQTIDGKTVKLSDFQGKTVMINIWWSGCEGCVEEAPYIQTAFNKLSSNPELAILTINTWDTPTVISKFIETHKLTFPVLIDPNKKLDPIYLKYGVPTTYFVDANGIVVKIKQEIFESPDEIEATFIMLQTQNPPTSY